METYGAFETTDMANATVAAIQECRGAGESAPAPLLNLIRRRARRFSRRMAIHSPQIWQSHSLMEEAMREYGARLARTWCHGAPRDVTKAP